MPNNRTPRGVFPSHFAVLATFLAALSAASLLAQAPSPARAGNGASGSVAAEQLAELDDVLQRSIDNGEIPGGVLLVGHRGRIIYRKAFGDRAILPAREPMTPETIFDLASLTKVIATAPSVMKLVEDGKLRINDPIRNYLPEFASHGKDQITLRMLLTHTSGLAPDPPIAAAQAGADALWKEICAESLDAPPGMHFEYSDTGYIVLGKLVERIASEPLEHYADRMFYAPLRMTHTRFRPPANWLPQIAPTEEIAARRSSRSHRAGHWRRCRPRRPVFHRRRSRALLPDDARRWRDGQREGSACRPESFLGGDRPTNDSPGKSSLGSIVTRLRMGH